MTLRDSRLMMQQAPAPEFLAAVDLGSNSFHLAIARVVGARMEIIDRVQERVQLAAGLDDDHVLSAEAEARALACLDKFGQRLRGTPGARVRAIGTDTLRVAQNAPELIEKGSALLGHPIEVVSGDEEARLIYSGVAHGLPQEDNARQLVIDIGGGSTECIIGVGLNPEHMRSLHMGCISFSKRFFPDGEITRDRMRRAQIAAHLLFERMPRAYFAGDWQRVFGASGTLNALEEIVRANDFSSEGITRDSLTRLRDLLVTQGQANTLNIKGLKPSRQGVIAAGLAIARAAFRAFPIKVMKSTTYALREGVLFELLRGATAGDVIESTMARVARRFNADDAQARRVETTAMALFDQLAAWVSEGPEEALYARNMLSWAARVHEIGMSIAFHSYHKHGAYILENTPLPGLSRDDARLLSVLVLTHRRKLTRELFSEVAKPRRELAMRLAMVLRIAVHLHRTRGPVAPELVTLSATNRTLTLRFAPGHLETHPLTQADFEEEVTRAEPAGFTLVVC